MPTHQVKWFSREMGGAPSINANTNGGLIELLRACLMDGFNNQAVSSATYDGPSNEVTLEYGIGHGYLQHQIITVAGANEAEYNGEFRVKRINATSIVYTPDSTPGVGTATGSITSETTPVGGWSYTHEDVPGFRAILKSSASDATPYSLYINNNGNRGPAGGLTFHADADLIYNVTDIDTYDTVYDGGNWPASNAYGADEWWIIADDKMIYFLCTYAWNARTSVFQFGDIISKRPGDQGHCVYSAMNPTQRWDSTYTSNSAFAYFNTSYYRVMATAYNQTPGYAQYRLLGIYYYSGNVIAQYPSAPDNSFYVSTNPILVDEYSAAAWRGVRGVMPGVIQPLHGNTKWDNVVFDQVPGIEGVPVLFKYCAYDANNSLGEYLCAWRLDDWR